MNMEYAMDHAHDSGLRLSKYVAGYGSKVWTADGYCIWADDVYFWILMVGLLVGGVAGTGSYQLMAPMQHPHEREP